MKNALCTAAVLLLACTSCHSSKPKAPESVRPPTNLLGNQMRVVADAVVDKASITLKPAPDAVAGVSYDYRSPTDYNAALYAGGSVALFMTAGGHDEFKESPAKGLKAPVTFVFQQDNGQTSLFANGQLVTTFTSTGKIALVSHRGSSEFTVDIPGGSKMGRLVTP